jgi:hypothetical protein
MLLAGFEPRIQVCRWPNIGKLPKLHIKFVTPCFLTKLYNLYPSPNTIRVIESRRIPWTGCVISMGKMRNVYLKET